MNIRGTLKTCRTLRSSVCLAVKANRITNDTEVVTRSTNVAAPNNPCRVIVNFKPKTLKDHSASPGLIKLNKAGMAIKRENNGMNTHVLLRKNRRPMPEKHASDRQNKYITARKGMVFASITDIKSSRVAAALKRGSLACRNPFFEAYSSAKTDSFRKDRAPVTERSMKLLLFFLMASFLLSCQQLSQKEYSKKYYGYAHNGRCYIGKT